MSASSFQLPKSLPRACAGAAAAIALLVLLGWALDVASLKSVLASFITMKANTAIGLLLLAVALACLHPESGRAAPLRRVVAQLAALAVAAIGIATLLEYALSVDLRLDELLFVDAAGRTGIFPPGRLAPVTAVSFLLLSASLLVRARSRRFYTLSQSLTLCALVISFQALVGYLAGMTYSFGAAFYTQMAVHTALAFALLSFGILVADAGQGWMAIFGARSPGGFMARRLIVAAGLVPPAIHILQLKGQRLGLYDADFGVLLQVVGNVAFFAVITWRTATALHASYGRETAARIEAERLYAESERLGRLKDEFLAALSHELRTPLAVVQGTVEHWLQHPHDVESLEQDYATVGRNARALGTIIDDLIDMSNMLSGAVALQSTKLDLRAVVTSSLESAHALARAKGVVLEATLGEPAIVLGDARRLRQVYWSLLTNGIKFTPAGGRVAIAMRRHAGRVEIVVADTGEGIAADFLPYAFDRFRQEDSTTARRHGGLGLGLAIVRHVVEMHGGTITASSAGKQRGATFVVSLPLVDEAETPSIEAPRLAAPPRTLAPSLAVPAPGIAATRAETRLDGIRVLVVDDAPDVLFLVQRMLKARGATVTTADSAVEALRKIATARHDVLLSDIGMPDMDGYQLIRKVRSLDAASGGDIPAAALTAHARDCERQMALSSGFQVHLAKPIDSQDLAATVASLARSTGAATA